MTSNKPYLIRALYEWLVDNDATPYIMVNTDHPQVDIPQGIEKDGQVVLNIATRAVQGLEMTNDYISFSARFGGVSRSLYIPVQSVMAIYSMEDGEGMMFADDTSHSQATEEVADSKPQDKDKPSAPGLKIVK
jgi:stringent starvation protein B